MRSRGFSLLEVMIALAIFGLMIVGILAAQAGVAATNKKAANVGQAIELARCKMTEIEEKLVKDGYPDIDDQQSSIACCEGVETQTFACDTRVEKVTLPDPPSLSAGGDGGAGPAGGLFGGGGGPAGAGSAGAAGLNLDTQLDLDAGLTNIASQLAPQTGGQGTAGLLNMVMGIVYPSMKPMFEASIRRVTVTVKWSEGPNPQKFEIVQYVTNPQRGGFAPGMPMPPGAGGLPPSIGGAKTSGAADGVSPMGAGGLIPAAGALH